MSTNQHPLRIKGNKEIRILLYNLTSLKNGERPELQKNEKEDLIIKSSIILEQLEWDSIKGRDFLRNHFDTKTRHDLNKKELLEFNMLLNNELKARKQIKIKEQSK